MIMDNFVAFLVFGVLVGLTAIIVVIFEWWICKFVLRDFHFHKQTIEDVKENIIDSLNDADELGYQIIFRTPECIAYKKYNLHVVITGNGKEVIMVDLI